MSAEASRAGSLSRVEIAQIASAAFIYAYPMLYNYKTMHAQAIDRSSATYVGGFGRFRHYSTPYTAANREIVTPNNDTPYSWAWLDLRAEPWVLSVPALPRQRYNVFQWMDLFLFNFAYVGVRSTGFGAGNYLFGGPSWKGAVPAGIARAFVAETEFILCLGRTSLDGPADVPAVEALQAQYVLRPLSMFAGQRPPAAAPTVDWPEWNEDRALSLDFIAYLNLLLQFAQPTHRSEVELMARFGRIGIGPGRAFDAASLSADMRDGIAEGVRAGRATLAKAVATTHSSFDLFGSRDALQDHYLTRAVGAAMGIYGNSKDEAIYVGTREDTDGQPLDGRQRYVLHFEKGRLPPAQFFWSMTMYDLPGRHLVANPIDRYSIGDRTRGLVTNADGSLSIALQHDSPDRDLQANWLPAPAGPFDVIMRIYGPGPDALNGLWRLPNPRRVS
jgi:hypothetical protein